jgi:hypothetical protein
MKSIMDVRDNFGVKLYFLVFFIVGHSRANFGKGIRVNLYILRFIEFVNIEAMRCLGQTGHV